MGQLDVKHLVKFKDKALYVHHLVKDLEALDLVLKNDLIEKTPTRIGVEQELCLTHKDYFRHGNSLEILEIINDDHFTTQIGKYNIEINSDPLILKNSCFSDLHQQLDNLMQKSIIVTD